MKKCSRYVDFLEKNGALGSADWQDILVHAKKCPDCSLDMKIRSETMLICQSLKESEQPAHLHQYIMQGIDLASKENDTSTFAVPLFERAFSMLLRPLEFSLSLATILVIGFLLTLDYTDSASKQSVSITAKQAVHQSNKTEEANPYKLEKVSEEEVEEFLVKLDQFKKDYPEFYHNKKTQANRYLPVVLVKD